MLSCIVAQIQQNVKNAGRVGGSIAEVPPAFASPGEAAREERAQTDRLVSRPVAGGFHRRRRAPRKEAT